MSIFKHGSVYEPETIADMVHRFGIYAISNVIDDTFLRDLRDEVDRTIDKNSGYKFGSSKNYGPLKDFDEDSLIYKFFNTTFLRDIVSQSRSK